ncbi:hypothetical protein [Paraburkholderia tropica]|uniref:hypothetical protein n=1 Tax=Paraburkholderia tropica TaxID=92647 RepID=UPI0007ED19D8|nr:hypothetical protein [Paraburkholderia tropica]OBR53705.1 hypothetical protein A6456_12290 [Paraburkholderia tropica]
MSRRITTISPSFDGILAGLSADQCEAITARHEALLDAIGRRQHDRVINILAEPSPVPLVHITFGTPNNTSGFTALYIAALFGNCDAMRLLLAAGASLLGDIIVCGKGPFTLIDNLRMSLGSPDLTRAQKKGMKAAIRLLEQASDERGEDAESMQASVKKDRKGCVTVTVVNKFSHDVLDYGRARKASNRAMQMPAVLRRVAELMTGKDLGDNVVFASAEAEPMGGAPLH